ncbi:MAG: response regulator [Lentisphaeraceae bacterium]|nr:response regulator [Lentisphaeraceae bacterium]
MSALDLIIVDDDVNLLKGLKRTLHGKYNFVTASDVETALDLISENDFAVIISDMKMPYMYGDDFLTMVRSMSPNTVRICLSGESSMDQTVKAINNAEIYKFLKKPCDNELLTKTIDDAIKIYQKSISEKQKFDHTAKGVIYILLDMLNHVAPEITQQTFLVAKKAKNLSDRLGIKNQWELEVSILLMFHCAIHERVYNYDNLMKPETLIKVLEKSAQSLGRIPIFAKITHVLEQLIMLCKSNKIIKTIDDSPSLIKYCLFDTYWQHDTSREKKMLEMFDNKILPWQDILPEEEPDTNNSTNSSAKVIEKEIPLEELEPGMTVLQRISTSSGMTLIKPGEVITEKKLNDIMRFLIKGLVSGVVIVNQEVST